MTDVARLNLGGVGFFLLIVVPVFLYLKRRGESNKRLVLSIFIIWILWNLLHAPIHELSHMLGGLLVGLHLRDYQLIQHFWKGDFVRGFVSWQDGARTSQLLIMSQAPYLIDGLFILVGLFLFRRRIAMAPFPAVLLLTLTLLRPVYDLATNYAADTLLGGTGDFRFLVNGYPHSVIHTTAGLLMVLGAAGIAFAIVLATPKTQPA